MNTSTKGLGVQVSDTRYYSTDPKLAEIIPIGVIGLLIRSFTCSFFLYNFLVKYLLNFQEKHINVLTSLVCVLFVWVCVAK